MGDHMPETPVTRERLLASVLTLQEGDMLLVRAPSTTRRDELNEMAGSIGARLPDGVRLLILAADLAVEVVRPGDKAIDLTEAVARAKANPGTVVEVQP